VSPPKALCLCLPILIVLAAALVPAERAEARSEVLTQSEPDKPAVAGDDGEDDDAMSQDPDDVMLLKADVAGAIGLVEAHIRAAKELLAAGNTAEATAHLKEARDVLYPEMSDSLAEAGVPSLTDPLAATAKGDAAAVDAAIVALAAAREGVGTGVADPIRYAVKVAVALLHYGSDEYDSWINDPGPDTLIDYQGSRSAAQLAAAIIEPVKPAIAKLRQESADGIAAAMARILKAYPGTAPPQKPVVLEGDMNAMIDSINENGEGF
jgi:hypothetical protein